MGRAVRTFTFGRLSKSWTPSWKKISDRIALLHRRWTGVGTCLQHHTSELSDRLEAMEARINNRFDAVDIELETLASKLDRLEVLKKPPNPPSCHQSEILDQGYDRLEHTPEEDMNPSELETTNGLDPPHQESNKGCTPIMVYWGILKYDIYDVCKGAG